MNLMKMSTGLAAAGLVTLWLAAPGPVAAQQMDEAAPQTLVVSQWKCEVDHIGDIMAAMDSVARPVWQEAVDEGLFAGVGTFGHEWGDEWNFGIYYVAADKESFFSNHDELNSRVADVAPEDEEDPILTYCTEHRDNIYWLGPVAEGS